MDDFPPSGGYLKDLFRGIPGEPFHLGPHEGERPVRKPPVNYPGHVVHEGKELVGELLLLPERPRLPDCEGDLSGYRFHRLDLVLRPLVGFRPIEKQNPEKFLLVAERDRDEGPREYGPGPLPIFGIGPMADIVDDERTSALERLPRFGGMQQLLKRDEGGRGIRCVILDRFPGESEKEDCATGDPEELAQVACRFGKHRLDVEVPQKRRADAGQQRKPP